MATTPADILEYDEKQTEADRAICRAIAAAIEHALPEAEGKVWHGHPVWFIDGNPIVGYHRQKASMRVLFWSGQSFKEADLTAIGSFKAAGFGIESIEDFKADAFGALLAQARAIQWDYKNLPKSRALVKRTGF